MTLFTIDKITEKDSHRPATNAYHGRRFQPYHPYPTVRDDARFPEYLGDFSTPVVPVPTSHVLGREECLNSTGGSPPSPGSYSVVSSDSASPEPDNAGASSKATEKKSKPKSDADKKPPHSYIALIAMAILASKEKRLLLCDIYQFIQENYPFYRNNDRSWRNSIRHNLSLNECFIKCGRSGDGRGNFWAVHPANVEDFSRGDFHRRRARRRVRASDMMLHGYPMYHPYATPAAYPAPVAATPLGFVPMTMTTLPAPYTVPTLYPPGTQYPAPTAPLGYPVPAMNPLMPLSNPAAPVVRSPTGSPTMGRVSPISQPLSVSPPSPYTSARPGYPYPHTLRTSRSPYSYPVTTSEPRYPQTTLGLSGYSSPAVPQAVVSNSMGTYSSYPSMSHFLH